MVGPKKILVFLALSSLILMGSEKATADFSPAPYLDLFYLNGHLGYQIKGVNKSHEAWRSRLKFEFENMCLGGGVAADISDKMQVRIDGWGSLLRDLGTLIDKDVIGNDDFISSTSKEQMHAWGIAGKFRYWALQKGPFSLGPATQLGYDNFFFRAYDLKQVEIKGGTPTDTNYPGIASTYSQNRFFWLIGFDSEWMPLGWLNVEWTGFFSPVSYVWDTDNHILRTKLAHGNAIAYSFQTMLKVGFIIFKKLHLEAYATYFWLDSYWADQDQHWYGSADPQTKQGTTYNGINNKITRQDFTAGGRIKYDF